MTILAINRVGRFSVFLLADVVLSLHDIGVSQLLLLHHETTNINFVTSLAKMLIHSGFAQPCTFVPLPMWFFYLTLEKLVLIFFDICWRTYFCFKFRICQVFNSRSKEAWVLSSETLFGSRCDLVPF